MHQFAASLTCGIKSRGRLGYAFFLFMAVLFAFAQPSIDAQVPADNGKDTRAVWVAAHEGIVKLDPAAYAALLTVPDSEKTSHLAIDSHNLTLWALAKGTLTKYDFTGAPLLKTALPGSGDDDAADTGNAVLAVNQADGVVWIGISKKVLRYDAAGNPLGAISLSSKIASISFDEVGGRVWIATEKSVGAYDANGAFLGALALGKNPKVRALAFDNSAGRLWVAAGENLAAYTADGVFMAAAECEEVDALYADLAGGVWAIAHDRLYHYSKSAWLLYKSDEKSEGRIGVFSVDPFDRSLWLTDKKDFYHLNADGQTLYTAPLSSKAHAIAVYADTIPPALTVTAPAPASYTNNNRPVITLAYSDIGSGADPLTIAVTANGAQLAVTCAADAKRADCTPTAPMADGAHAIAAAVKDRAGNVSNAAKTSFTVDTVPPAITLAAPVNGAVTNNPSLTIAGSLNEPATLTFTHRATANGAPVVNGETIVVAASNTFSHGPIALAEGSNDFSFTAADRAGNRTQATALVTLDTVPPPAIALMNVSVSFPVGGIVTVLGLPGSAEPGSTITIVNNTTGLVTLVTAGATGGFTAVVNGGWWDVLTLTATDAAGNTGPPVTVQVVMPPPPAPLGVAATAGDAAATIDWQPTPMTDSYNLYYSAAGAVTTADAKMVNVIPPFVHTGLNNGTTYSYAVAAVNSGGESPLSAQVSARPLPPIPVAPSGVTATAGNGEVGIAWNSVAGADSYTIYYSSAPGVTKASATIANAASPYLHTGLTNGSAYYYAVAAVNLGGEGPLSAEVSATPVQPGPALPPDPAKVAPPNDLTKPTDIAESMAFLYTGANAIQQGVAPGTIEARRVAVIRGKVITRDGAPLPGVTITIKDHPEFGSTLSRADGMFDMALNGGGVVVVNYNMAGWLPAQRLVNAPWRDFVNVDDVALIQLDPQVSTVDLANATAIQVAQGSVQTDVDGSRQATMLFQPGTTATMTMPDGTTVPLTTLNVRATEYTVGANGMKAMPAEIAANTGYTYAVEYSVDEALAAGASTVTFSQPVYSYVDNFLNFKIGTVVPSGYYDKQKAQWVPSENGLVVAILSVDTAGLAQVDLYGAGSAATAAQLTAAGFTDAERQKLATLYAPGKSLWRVPAKHFSIYDYNWAIVCLFCEYYAGVGPISPIDTTKDPNHECGSIIDCQNQSLGEEQMIVGTPRHLHYASSGVKGNAGAYMLNIPLTSSVLPLDLAEVDLVIDVAGQHFTRQFPGKPDLAYTFLWDGKDGYGRDVQGSREAHIRIGYVFKAYYRSELLAAGTPPSQIPVFSHARPANATGDLARKQITYWTDYYRNMGRIRSNVADLGGWELDNHHLYDFNAHKLYKGDGTWKSAEDQSKVVKTFAGNGSSYGGSNASIEGVSALNFPVPYASGLAIAADGSMYIVIGNKVIKIKPDGIATVVAGADYSGFSGDGGPATQALLRGRLEIALGPDGSLYIADIENCRLRKVTPDGIINTIAGNGGSCGSPSNYWIRPPANGDGMPATQVPLAIASVAVTTDGSVFFLDVGVGLRKIENNGLLSTVTGAAVAGSITAGPNGSIYAVSFNYTVIKIDSKNPMGVRIAGNGCLRGAWGYCYSSFGGDGGPANLAYLHAPVGLAVGPDGSVYINDYGNSRIRKVAPDGIISTVAGNGCKWDPALGCSTYDYPDGAVATSSYMIFTYWSYGPLAVDQLGNIYFWNQNRIRSIVSAMPGVSMAETAIASEDGAELYIFLGGRHLRTLDAHNGAVKYLFAYDVRGHLASVTDSDGNVITVQRDAQGKPLAIVAPDGQKTSLTPDANGYLASIADPAGNTATYTYDALGLMATYTDARGGAYAFTYDTLGRLTKDTNPAGGLWALVRAETALGHSVTMTSAEGRGKTYLAEKPKAGGEVITNTGPDGLQTLKVTGTDGVVTTTMPDGTISTVQQGPDPRFGMQSPLTASQTVKTPSGLVYAASEAKTVVLATPNEPLSLTKETATTTVNGKTYTTVYDNTLKKTTATSPAGRQNIAMLDANGKVTKSQTPGLADVDYAYDARGRLTGIATGVAPDTRNTSLAYGADGNVASVMDALGGAIAYSYDAAGRVVSKTLKDGRVIGFTYDANGNVTSITPPSRPGHIFGYNGVDLETLYSPPAVAGGGATQYAYNLDKQLTLITRPDGQAVSLRYDTVGRLAAMTTPNGATTYGYNATTGKLTDVTSSNGETLGYTYDGFLPLSESWSGPVAGSVGRTYNADFRVTSLNVNGVNSIPLAYDADGLLTGAGSLAIIRSAQTGFVTGATLGGTSTAYTYNTFGELASEWHTGAGAVFYDVAYTRDKLGRITSKLETIGGVATTYGYVYDTAGRLIQVSKNGSVTAAYAYDLNGNRLGKTDSIGTTAGTYDAQDRLLSYGANSYAYTANGELLTKTNPQGTTSYNYDVLGNLTSATLPDGTFIEYVIDGANRRIGKKINGVLVQGFLYANQLNPIAELDGAGNVVSTFIYGTKANVPDYMVKNGTTYRIISDHLGSPVLVADSTTGTVAQQISYDEFGVVTTDTNSGFTPFGFGGGLYDNQTKFVRFGARDYDAETGRWASKDPIRFTGGDTNLYGYVLNDPVNFRDPSGLAEIWIGNPPPAGSKESDFDKYRKIGIGKKSNPKFYCTATPPPEKDPRNSKDPNDKNYDWSNPKNWGLQIGVQYNF